MPECYFDSCAAELREASACDGGVWVWHRGYDSLNSCSDDCVCAGASAARGAAGFEGEVEGCAARFLTGFFKGDDFGMVAAIVVVETFADDAVIFDDDAADAGVGVGEGGAALGEGQGTGEV